MKRVRNDLTFFSLTISFLLISQTCRAEDEIPLTEEEENYAPAVEIKDVTSAEWEKTLKENSQFLVFFYQTTDEQYEQIRYFLESYEIPAGFSGELTIFQSSDVVLANVNGVTNLPGVLYYRQNYPVPYDGEINDEEFTQWLLQAQLIATKTLTDDNFEHLTQAVTGSTTGDWLVVFYKDTCKASLPAFETVAVRLKGKTNIAKVDMVTNTKLVDRFSLTKCPSVIFFRQGSMYRHEVDKLSAKVLMSFVQAWYRNMKAEKIPFEPTAFDKVTEEIALYIKKQVNGPNGTVIIGVTGGVTFLLLLSFIMCCCCSRRSADQSNKNDKKLKKS